MTFIRNTWYAAAWSGDIGRKLFSRTLLNEPVLFYRREDGSIVAMRDRCPHRLVPLSMGRLVGDDVECIYHGLKFDGGGRCIANPNGSQLIPKAAAVDAYRVVERHQIVWIWMGEQALADEAQVPDLPWLADPEHFTETHGTTTLPASYLLVVDNLMDLRHTAFLHSALEPRDHALIPVKDYEENGRVWAKIFSENTPPPPFFAMKIDGRVDHWQEMLCYPPGVCAIFYGVTAPGRPRKEGLDTINISLVTPETDRSSHYLWASARDFDLDDGKLTEAVREGSAYAFANEDAPVLAAQQQAIGDRDLMEFGPVLFSNDVAAGRVRRIIERRLAEERQGGAPTCGEGNWPPGTDAALLSI